MLETLFVIGFALMVAAVVGVILIAALKVVCAVLWIPLKVAGWFIGGVASLVGGLIGLALLPFALAGTLLALVLSLVFSPPFLLLVIGIMAWMLYNRRSPVDRPQLPDAPTQA